MKRKAFRVFLVTLCLLALCTAAYAQSVPYTIELCAETEIYKGPGADYGYSKLVGEDGVYAIVEEAYDEYGSLWGRLKSGAGWVELPVAEYVMINEVPYRTSLTQDDAIYNGPGYAYGFAKDVGEDGVYTIVEEAICENGFLWGRLKSGAGWVQLTDAPVEAGSDFSETPYTVPLSDWVPIYSAPGYEECWLAGIVGEDGVYTIVNEVFDYDGNLWGELKSGAGWVDLTYVFAAGEPPMTAYYADDLLLEEDSFIEYSVEESEYTVRIAFRANERLDDVRFAMLAYDEDTYAVDTLYNSVSCLEENTYFVAGVVFYGDMTTYGISFIDTEGEERYFAVSVSGKDGSLVVEEYIP